MAIIKQYIDFPSVLLKPDMLRLDFEITYVFSENKKNKKIVRAKYYNIVQNYSIMLMNPRNHYNQL